MVPQQNRRVHAAPPNGDTHASERLAGAEAHEEDVTDVGLVEVLFGEEASARRGGVKASEFGLGKGFEGLGADFFDGEKGSDDWDVFFLWTIWKRMLVSECPSHIGV